MLVVWLIGAPALVPLTASAASGQDAERGKPIYDRWCAGCHGETGAGDGEAAAFMLPRPRDFTRAVYQIRTTPNGELPTDADLARVIDDGMPGTAMPGWSSELSSRERDDVIAYLKTLSRFFTGDPPPPVDLGSAPGRSAEGLIEGRAVYETLECFKCHGDAGRGDGTSAPTLTDDWDIPILPADLSENWLFNGGGSVEQIYTRLRTGVDGTPMPSFTDALEGGVVTEEQLWRLAQYVNSLSPAERPRVREVIRAALTETLPAAPDDSVWGSIEPYYVPMVGQIIAKPRWFSPAVTGLWVRAAHDGERLTLLLTWNEPSRSPDPAWDEWIGRMATTMTDVDGPLATTQGPDRMIVHFPLQPSAGMERPYFLGGDSRRPVHQWQWTSTPDALQEGTARGLGTFVPLGGDAVTRHAASFADGQWRLQVTRALVPADTAGRPTFVVGQATSIGFIAADGSHGEDELRSAISAWFTLHLDAPTPSSVYLAPAVAVLLTVGLGLVVVSRAQRSERRVDHL